MGPQGLKLAQGSELRAIYASLISWLFAYMKILLLVLDWIAWIYIGYIMLLIVLHGIGNIPGDSTLQIAACVALVAMVYVFTREFISLSKK